MNRRPWKLCFLLSLLIHTVFFLLLFFIGVNNTAKNENIPPALEIGIVPENAVFSADKSAESKNGAAGASSRSVPKIRMMPAASLQDAEDAITNSKQTLKKAVAPTAALPQQAAQLTDKQPPPSTDGKAVNDAPAFASDGKIVGDAGEQSGYFDGNKDGSDKSGVGDDAPALGLGAGFSDNGDGSYTAETSADISYTILRDAEVDYPEEARSLGYGTVVTVSARILVGTGGQVESVILLSDAPNLGFRQAAEEALWGMRFAPIIYQGYPIKLWFEKNIVFTP